MQMGFLRRKLRKGKGYRPRSRAPENPLRAELFSDEQLCRHAVALAEQHQLDPKPGPNRLLPQLADNEQALIQAYDLMTGAEDEGRRGSPAGEWLLDNFYLVEEQIRLVRSHLPRTYSHELPRLSNGATAGFPRVYDIALELIAHADGRVDAENIRHFVAAYQSVNPLTLGELWAVPIMLRLGLIENLRLVSAHVVGERRDLRLAERWADRLLAAADENPAKVLRVLAEMAESEPPFSNAFVEEFRGRLQGQGSALAPVESWVQHRLAEQGLTRERLQRADTQTQAADQVSIGNSIGSLRGLNAIDWRTFVEEMSGVEQALRADPMGVYAGMDFATRDRYRHVAEELARQSGTAEDAVARAAVELAAEACRRDGPQSRTAHVGYYLIDRGRAQLEHVVGVRWSLRRFCARPVRRFPVGWYVGALAVITMAVAGLLLEPVRRLGGDDWRVWLMLALGIVAASQMAVALVNLAANLLIGPRPLPRLDFSKGIPPADRTMVAIPTLLTSEQAVAELLEGMEIRYLGNRDLNLFFALLTDFRDAPEAAQADDAELLRLAREGIRALNVKYGCENATVFYLFHRPRVWNPHERLWMGYERKRGKLEQFNALLRGGPREPFSEIVGNPALLSTIRYVLTLDTDTAMPRDSARKLVGTMAHPLNRPLFDPAAGRVVEGYAILQPRTPIGLTAAHRSRFAQLSAGEAGIDPYTREVSDVYQDLFAEGSYVGKGIYDVDAFRQATAGRFPENLILSHDLVESGYARSALVSDVELHEDHPASFLAEMSRRHRWIRGDWQIAGWLLPSVLGQSGKRAPNTLTALVWWKIFDNLRRSLLPPALFLLLLGGWAMAVPVLTGFWILFALVLLLLPIGAVSLVELIRKPRGRTWAIHCVVTLRSVGRQVAEAAFSLCTLPYRAIVHLDAIFVSAGRMPFTRRGLLLWHTPRYERRNCCRTPGGFLKEMWVAPLFGILAAGWLALVNPAELFFSGPLLLLWMAAPAVGWWISRPLSDKRPVLSETQRAFLHGLARQTWRYFETLVNEDENWLPPDNLQETPTRLVAARTSPTNIGMALLSNLAAWDFGYLPTGELLDRTEKTLGTVERLERYRGHLYNWYDTRTLAPLPPLYVSSVDSGNLAGALETLRSGLLELKTQPIVSPRLLPGLRDTLDMAPSPALASLRAKLDAAPPRTAADALMLLQELCREIETLPADDDADRQACKCALARQCRAARDDLQHLNADLLLSNGVPTLHDLAGAEGGGERAAERISRIDRLAQRCAEQAEMDFAFLYDPAYDLLAIGYNVSERRRDPGYYDLLASEARLASFILIARDQLPQEHWFALGRQLTTHAGAIALLSWSGSMFEYLMPLLVMPTYEHTLLDWTYRAVVVRQIEYGRQRGVPWGVSESCYNATDAHGVFQYGAFGVPGLGLKRGLADDLVIAPYASVLALMVMPREACRNLEALAEKGYGGAYGLYEAIDFSPARMPRDKGGVLLRSYMAHHQGMSLLALAHLLLDCPMQRRFLSNPAFKAAELLLHERIPKAAAPLHPHAAEVSIARRPPEAAAALMRVFPSPDTPMPHVHLLSNGRYHVMVTHAGGGYSRWKDLAVTRWREDATCDGWGMSCYVRDVATGELWSTAYHPTRRVPQHGEAIFLQGRAEYRRRDEDIEAHTEIAVSPEDDVEVRRVTLTNFASRSRTIELTSYAEIVLAPLNTDLAHPAFSNLFVRSEILRDSQAILCTRRPRAPGETPPWMFHLMTTQGTPAGDASYETDRARFIGRGRFVNAPAAFDETGPLSGTEGATLDPIVAIRRGVVIEADTSANWHIVSGIAETRAAALALIAKYREPSFAARAFEMAWSHSQLVLRQLQAAEAEAQVYVELAGSVLHANPRHRADAGLLARNRLGQSGLWSFGISGDLPIVLLHISDAHRIERVSEGLKAHAYWREKGLKTDLVILNEDFSGYRQVLQERILGLIAAGTEAHRVDKPGGIFPRRIDQLSEEQHILLQTVARVILDDSTETLTEQVTRPLPVERRIPPLLPSRAPLPADTPSAPPPRERLFFNGLGGFTPDGHEYVISLGPGQTTPAPWVNVLANAQIGTVISESGGAYTWVDNAHEFRLTPWHNDPVGDPGGEAFYIRDEETGQFWSPTPLPARGNGTYVCRHGFGYSVFEYTQFGIESELWTYVAVDAPVKMVSVKMRNRSGRSRKLSVTGYWEWVLGQWRHTNLMHIVTAMDPATGALFAHNVHNPEFADKTVFVNVSGAERTVTCNRAEFLGRNGTPASPAAMRRENLSGRTGEAFDPCAAMQANIELADGEERELVFVLGAGNDAEAAHRLIRRFGGRAGARQALESVWEFWKRTLGVVYVETPDPALNLMANGWLEYQSLAARYWGRSGYYQSGGAYGFRDQLQDTTALLHAAPWTAREHLLRCGGRQFKEGDVQHWWHPPSGRGVRTHCSDDYLWLPYAACRYVKMTGDTGVLDERVPYIEGRPVNADEESYYDLPRHSGNSGTLYEHCVRAIEYGLRFGDHGLPLIGSGDWNDGMNLVGAQGRGESVWLAFFLYDVLRRFVELARRRGDAEFAERCEGQASQLRRNIELQGWDGEWYRRAYFDDGSPLGSAANEECQIDGIAQSWAVLSGAAQPARARQAMDHVYRRLVRREDKLIRLFDPPFDKSAVEPGYIKGYPPGVRENGGQYTHGAIWTAMAFARLGEIERAWELFSLLNPVRHATDAEGVDRYKVEPYVVAADIYGAAPHTGRGGWTWYTGSAGWMYRLLVETLLGVRLEAGQLRVNPRLPRAWPSIKLHYRHRATFYHIHVTRTEEAQAPPLHVVVDGQEQPDGIIRLVDDRREHTVAVTVR